MSAPTSFGKSIAPPARTPFSRAPKAATLLLLGLALSGARPPAPGQATDDERRPNVIPPSAALGSYGTGAGEFLGARAAAWGKDDRLFIADTGNHRIQVLSAEGKALSERGRVGAALGGF